MARGHVVDVEVKEAIVNLRIAGVPERSIYEALRDTLDIPPSYRDIRTVFAENGVATRAQATMARRRSSDQGAERQKGEARPTYYLTSAGESPIYRTHYAAKRANALEVDRTSDAREAFDRRYTLGYLARAGVQPEDVADEGVAEALSSIYDGEGS